MRINGRWAPCDADGVERPIVEAEVLAADGSWSKLELLLDTGADRTVFSPSVLTALGFPRQAGIDKLGGVGGDTDYVYVETAIRITSENVEKVILRSTYAAFEQPESLDMSVIGRDILNLFELVVDYRKSVICLLAESHTYAIVES